MYMVRIGVPENGLLSGVYTREMRMIMIGLFNLDLYLRGIRTTE